MNNPSLYATVNDLQKRDAGLVLQKTTANLQWGPDEAILDVGCGPGDLTTSLLYSYLPEDVSITGCDISEEMVKYAENKYGNKRFNFKQMDIGNSNIWMNWEEESYDKIFSFYCLHWVVNQKQAALNMNSLLKPDGHLVTMFTISHPFLRLFKYLTNEPKWKSYTKVWGTWEVLLNGKDPVDEYTKVLESSGFKVISCTKQETSFVHLSLDHFIDYFESINPFKKRIPKEKTTEFLEDCASHLIEKGLIKKKTNDNVVHEYTIMITHAQKLIHV